MTEVWDSKTQCVTVNSLPTWRKWMSLSFNSSSTSLIVSESDRILPFILLSILSLFSFSSLFSAAILLSSSLLRYWWSFLNSPFSIFSVCRVWDWRKESYAMCCVQMPRSARCVDLYIICFNIFSFLFYFIILTLSQFCFIFPQQHFLCLFKTNIKNIHHLNVFRDFDILCCTIL